MKLDGFEELEEATRLQAAANGNDDEDDDEDAGLDRGEGRSHDFDANDDEDDEEEEVTLTSDDDDEELEDDDEELEIDDEDADEEEEDADHLLVASTHKEEADLLSEAPSPVKGYTPATRLSKQPESNEAAATVGQAPAAKKAAKKSTPAKK